MLNDQLNTFEFIPFDRADDGPIARPLSDLELAEPKLEPSEDLRGAAEVAAQRVIPLTPRQRIDKLFAELGLDGLDVEFVIEAGLFGAHPLPKGREEDAQRMADLISGARRGLPDGPLVGAEDLTSEQLAELERLRPILRRMMGDVERRLLADRRATPVSTAPREPQPRMRVRVALGPSRERRPGPCRESGSRRSRSASSSRARSPGSLDEPPSEPIHLSGATAAPIREEGGG